MTNKTEELATYGQTILRDIEPQSTKFNKHFTSLMNTS